MCSVFCDTGSGKDKAELKAAFDRSISRGPDQTASCMTGEGWMQFHRLSIMGLTEAGMQPFTLKKNAVVCNGELYGFRKLKKELVGKGYSFRSDSDCELLLPLYAEYGTDMFEKLDAEYALVLYDGEKDCYLAARDPMGIRPLYYGFAENGKILFASEPKCLVGLCHGIRPFPPGHYYQDGQFVCYHDCAADQPVCHDGVETACAKIRALLTEGICKRLDADAPMGFLLSGGLDSSLVCAVAAKELKKPIRTFAVGMEKDAIDLKYAKEVADFIGSDHTEIYITKQQVLDALDEVIAVLGTYDITTIRASMGMYLICKAIHETTDVRVLLTGEISDELFGYKYTDYAPNAAAFQEESKKRIRELHAYDVLRADRCISANSMEARVPFGDLAFVDYVMHLDPEIKRNHYQKGKYLLRHAFEADKILPEEILWREKAAFSDAVGHSLVDDLKEYAAGYYSDAEFEEKCKKYDHARPFTKESLLYREIFERHYPGMSDLIPGFWMPNKDWEGCNVNDPSARVLANYGASGI